MKSILLATSILMASMNVFAATPAGQCANMAKYAAISAYFEEVSGADRSNLEYQAKLVATTAGVEKYSVSVSSPCYVDGDDGNCNMDYDVVLNVAPKCSVQSVQEAK